jgi:arylsulfatase
MSMQDWVPTLLAAAGEPDVKEKLMKGHQSAGKTFKVHLDGYNLLPHLMGKEKASPRDEFFYFSDDGLLVGVRHKQWKLVFAEQRAKTFRVWSEPFVQLRIPKPFNLRSDPFERADTDSNNYDRWWIQRSAFSVTAIQEIVGEFIGTFKDFPPRQKPAKFNVDDVMAQMYKTGAH